jgi:hypothetical protein
MDEMNVFAACFLLAGALVAGASQAAEASLPKRNLTVELRQTEQGREHAGHYSAGGDSSANWESQMVQVRNGEKALLRLFDAIPLQWTQAVMAPNSGGNGNGNAGGNASGARSNTGNQSANSGAGVNNGLLWFDAGQSIAVQPKWPGGNQPAVLEIEVQRASVDQRMGADLPQQTRNTVSTTISAPLAEWVTIAVTGKAPKPGVYSSESGLQVRRLLQIRVMAP